MNLITVIIIAILMWLIYSLIQSYRSLEKELKEIRAKCIIGTSGGHVSTHSINSSNVTKASIPMNSLTPVVNSQVDTYQSTQTGDDLTPSAPVNTPVKVGYTRDISNSHNRNSGTYTSDGEQVYSQNSLQKYDNDPMSSMKANIIDGLNVLKAYSAI